MEDSHPVCLNESSFQFIENNSEKRNETMDHRHNRYAFLDGIRGMAAIFVVTLHTHQFWNVTFSRSYLAVDLFFVLSGFVIAHAYDERLRNGNISPINFLTIRLIRLYPVFFLSLFLCSLLAIGFAIFKNHANFDDLSKIVTMILMTAFFLPTHMTGRPDLFSINSPYWSLFFELITNMMYATIRPFLTNLLLSTIVISSALMIAAASYHHGNLDEGYSWGFEPIAVALIRSVFGIFMGLLLHRHRVFLERHFSNLISPWFAFLVIAIVLSSPSAGLFNSIIDVLSVVIVFPVCVIFASQGRSSKFERVLLTLGTVSYPIYVIHLPVSGLLGHWLKGVDAPLAGVIFVAILILLSVWIEKLYDIPLRSWLTGHVLQRNRFGRKGVAEAIK